MSETLDPSLAGLGDCGCCAGISAETPVAPLNRPGLDRIQYRIGDHGAFKRTMLAALSEAGHPKLRELGSRADDDFSIALLDAWAVTADVLTFYQERLASESYLETATEHGSVLRLARLIGYDLKPGVAATAWLAFTLETAPGAPESALVATGAKVQSVPGQDESPQIFETIEDLGACGEWNAMRPRMTEDSPILRGATIAENIRHMYLRGAATQLQPGDAILIVGDERRDNPGVHPLNERWDVRILTRVTASPEKNWTRVEWSRALGKASIEPAHSNPRVYAFRLRAALFGHNAPNPANIDWAANQIENDDWKGFAIPAAHFDLDASYAKVTAGSWLALAIPSATEPDGNVELYRASAVSFPSVAQFALAGKVTRVKPDTVTNLSLFGIRETIVHAQSESLELIDPPLTTRADDEPGKQIDLDETTLAPVQGRRIDLDRQLTRQLARNRTLIVAGKRQRVTIVKAAPPLDLTDDRNTRTARLQARESLILMKPPARQPDGRFTCRLRRDDGLEGTLANIEAASLRLSEARTDDPTVHEVVVVQSCEGRPSVITLADEGLKNILDRATVAVFGNVARSTHGETVEEYGGSGDAAQTFQKFKLRQGPLTYLRAAAASGVASTLQVRVDDLLWQKAPSLYRRGPDERIYIERAGDGEQTTVHFGDGVNGARLPSGQQNVRFKYRKGSGLAGLVKAGQLSQLLTRPLGVTKVENPLPAEGGDDPESLADARQNAPLTVLTLERVVSLQDHEDFARAYPGIGKALTTWTWDGRKRGVLLTVAGPRGEAVGTGPGSVGRDLLKALRAAGDPFVPLRVETYRPAWFEAAGTITVDPVYEKEKVLAAARDLLRKRFSFAARAFGQPVFLSEIIGVIHSAPGVTAVDVDRLRRFGLPGPDLTERLLADFPGGGSGSDASAAELLLLRPESLEEFKASP